MSKPGPDKKEQWIPDGTISEPAAEPASDTEAIEPPAQTLKSGGAENVARKVAKAEKGTANPMNDPMKVQETAHEVKKPSILRKEDPTDMYYEGSISDSEMRTFNRGIKSCKNKKEVERLMGYLERDEYIRVIRYKGEIEAEGKGLEGSDELAEALNRKLKGFTVKKLTINEIRDDLGGLMN